MEEDIKDVAVVSNNSQKMLSVQETREWYNGFVQFTKEILKENLDFGIIPGTAKPSLYKPGAEKLRFVYGLGAEFECIDKTTDLSIPYVDYTYKCTIRNKNGQVLAQCEGNCNSMEPKFGFLWVPANEVPTHLDLSTLKSKTSGKVLFEFTFAIDKGETTGQYGKPKEYWDNWRQMISSGKAKATTKKTKTGKDYPGYELNDTVTVYRIPNPDVVGMKNTIMKMSQKRSFVGAVLIATGASEFFTQDVEDMEINGNIHSDTHPVTDIEVEITNTPAAEVKPPAAKTETPPAAAPPAKKHPLPFLEKMDKNGKDFSRPYARTVELLGKKEITLEMVKEHYQLTEEMEQHLQAIVNTNELFPNLDK